MKPLWDEGYTVVPLLNRPGMVRVAKWDGVTYDLDLIRPTCTCPAFAYKGRGISCKHLDGIRTLIESQILHTVSERSKIGAILNMGATWWELERLEAASTAHDNLSWNLRAVLNNLDGGEMYVPGYDYNETEARQIAA